LIYEVEMNSNIKCAMIELNKNILKIFILLIHFIAI